MRFGCAIIVALSPLSLASPAVAQSSAENMPSDRAASPSASRQPGVRLFVPAIADTGAYGGGRDTIFGSVPIAENIDLHVGAARVNRYKRGQRALSQHPLRDVGGMYDKIAAAGLRFRF